MRSRLPIATALALGLTLPAVAVAQQSGTTDQQTPMEKNRQPLDEAAKEMDKADPSQRDVGGSSGGVTVGTSAREALQSREGTIWSKDKLVGHTLYGADDEVGEISEVVAGQDGDIQAVVVDVGSFLGIGSKRVAVPIEELRIDGTRVMASALTRRQAENLKAYEAGATHQ